MLILFGRKSSAMCRNLRVAPPEGPAGLNPALLAGLSPIGRRGHLPETTSEDLSGLPNSILFALT